MAPSRPVANRYLDSRHSSDPMLQLRPNVKSSKLDEDNSFASPAPAPARAPAIARTAAPTAAPSTVEQPPPPYTAVVTGPTETLFSSSSAARPASIAPSATSQRSAEATLRRINASEDPYAFLNEFDTVFLIDDSTSMTAQRRWQETADVLRQVAPICTAHDEDGVDVYFLNRLNRQPGAQEDNPARGFKNVVHAAQVDDLFHGAKPCGATPTGKRIQQILNPYVKEFCNRVNVSGLDPYETGMKPINLIVITDGAPTDVPEEIIAHLAKKLDQCDAPAHQVGIQFFQVGDDAEATRHLNELDDLIPSKYNVRDMVDTVSWGRREGNKTLTAATILKIVLGAVVRRLDNAQRKSGESQRQRGGLAP
ncbi:hypothetical protein P8C59_006284 [Phyllachora maydis]|uniref:VWFA domain-containing protein n=1 Tax=Phyllachora maydis TaxID=1825666 RepID=A0AAD9I607_9PEZI|nr:hypothetical protein P8C59_006284 [Phyllachora maydis]